MTTKQETFLAPRVQKWTNLSSGLTAGGFFLFMKFNRDAKGRILPGPIRDWRERFWENVDKNGSVPLHRPELGPCWEWQGLRVHGYGALRISKSQRKMAHRLSYFLATGHWPDPELDICHACDNPPCVNPEHLWEGTQKQNIQDASAKGRLNISTKGGRGELNVNAKLSWKSVAMIRAEWASKRILPAKLGSKYGVGHQAIRAIVRNETWRPEHCPL